MFVMMIVNGIAVIASDHCSIFSIKTFIETVNGQKNCLFFTFSFPLFRCIFLFLFPSKNLILAQTSSCNPGDICDEGPRCSGTCSGYWKHVNGQCIDESVPLERSVETSLTYRINSRGKQELRRDPRPDVVHYPLNFNSDIFAISSKSSSFVSSSSFLFMQIAAMSKSENGFGFPAFMSFS